MHMCVHVCVCAQPFLQYKEVVIRSTKINLWYMYCFLYGDFQGFVLSLASSRLRFCIASPQATGLDRACSHYSSCACITDTELPPRKTVWREAAHF